MLLSFALAHGSINHILDVIMALLGGWSRGCGQRVGVIIPYFVFFLDHLSSDMKVVPLLLKMDSILKEKLFKHGELQ